MSAEALEKAEALLREGGSLGEGGSRVISDNRQTMHRVRRCDETQPRDMRRTMVAGDAMTVWQQAAE